MPWWACPLCSAGGMAVVGSRSQQNTKKRKKWAYLVHCTSCPFSCPPALPRYFPSLLVHLQPPVVMLLCRLLCRLLGLMWRHCRRIAAILAVLFHVLAVFWHAVGGRRGGEEWGGVGDGWGMVEEWWRSWW